MYEITISDIHKLFLAKRSVSIDTRTIIDGDLFFGLKGPNFDGNRYASRALESGASHVIVDDPELQGVVSGDERYILVRDVLSTLQSLATYHRKYSNAKIIGITGSNGKTTTKELLATVLAEKYDIIYTKGNLNNHIGVPLTLLTIKGSTEIAIIEMGANHIGEIAMLSGIALPDFGLITNIGYAHIEGFGSLEGVKKGKGELYESIKSRQGHLFVHEADTVLTEMADGYEKTSYYSKEHSFDGQEVSVDEKNDCLQVSFDWKGERVTMDTHLYGAYNTPNILAALNVGFYFDVKPTVGLKAVSEYMPENSRSQRLQTESNEIYLDAYNANPSSMEHALNAFSKIEASKKLVILGDMFELGDQADSMHQRIADLAGEQFEQVILVGKHFKQVNSRHLKCDDTDQLKSFLQEKRLSNTCILLKGSRGMALEKVIETL